MKLTVTERVQSPRVRGRRPRVRRAAPTRGGADAGRPAGGQPRRARGRPGGARGRDDARRLDLGGGGAKAGRNGRGDLGAAGLVGEAQPGASLAGDPRGGGAGGVASDRLPGAGDLGQRADRARGRRGAGADRRLRLGRHGGAVADPRDRPLLRHPGGGDQPDQGPAWLVASVLARRGDSPHRDLHRLHRRDQPPARPAARVRVPRRRAQDDLLLRGGRPADAGARRALLASPSRAAARASCWS